MFISDKNKSRAQKTKCVLRIGTCIILLSYSSFSQNVLKDAKKIIRLKEEKNYIMLLDILSHYKSDLEGKTPNYISTDANLKFRSKELENFINPVRTDIKTIVEKKELELNNAELDLSSKINLLRELDSLKPGLFPRIQDYNKVKVSEIRTALYDKEIVAFLKGKALEPKDILDTAKIKKGTGAPVNFDLKVVKKALDYMESKFVSPQKESNNETNFNLQIQTISAQAKSSIGLSQSEIIDALAIFMANRVKEETMMAFMEIVYKNLDKIEPLPCLFKNTIKELGNYPEGQPTRFGSLMKKAIATDLYEMPNNIVNCNLCATRDLKQFENFTSFFSEIAAGEDVIRNIDYYAESQMITNPDQDFNLAMRFFQLVNRNCSNLGLKEDSLSTWIRPQEFWAQSEDELRLSLALISESDSNLVNTLLRKSHNVNNIDQLFQEGKLLNFKVNFRELLNRLQKLDSYWRSQSKNGIFIVDPKKNEERLKDVFSFIYMKLGITNYPPNNEAYKMYINAREAAAQKDVDGIIYESQKLLDLLDCYELKLPHLSLPELHMNLNWNTLRPMDTLAIKWINNKFRIKWGRIDLMDSLHIYFKNSERTAKLMKFVIDGHDFEFGSFMTKNLNLFKQRVDSGRFEDALSFRFHPIWRSLFMWNAHKLSFVSSLNRIRKIHKWQEKFNPSTFACYYKSDADQRNKLSFNSSRREVSQLLNFFTDVIKAKDSKQLSNVISEYAEPPTTYKIKRFNRFSWDLNAYPGVYAGFETPAGDTFALSKRTRPVVGITAPIGISFSFGGRRKFKCEDASKYPAYINRKGEPRSFRGRSHGISFIFIDIGAAFAYRLTNDADYALPQELSFKQVFAPGAFYTLGFRNLPFVMNVGIQYTPQIRSFTQFGKGPMDAYRLQISFAYDIPLLNFTNTTKRRTKVYN